MEGLIVGMEKRNPKVIASPSWCVLCSREEKTINDIFLHCKIEFYLWAKLCKKPKIYWASLAVRVIPC